ncbi:Na+/H+ antiporter NhaA [Compostibacter hankyongensis]|uniref:Na(+)/H(+) antiporter NhaA n=1 Tax=Compostibacter hankyongensis TaxID=1007089 RepID=A0ABP8FQ28_9BACT
MADKPIRRLLSPLKEWLQDSRSVGIVLIACTAVSLLLSNLPFSSAAYTSFWEKEIHLPTESLSLPHSILHWINDGLMAVFFFLAGLEIKRELLKGELSSPKKSMLPVLAALGGMICPALIFLLFNGNTPYHHGWGIPMATDIAFSLGIVSLLGNRVPLSLKVFLTALAIIDDLGAIITIAIFYSTGLQPGFLLAGLGIIAALALLNLLKVRQPLFYFLPGLVVWYCIFNSGIHATISGVLLAFCMPMTHIEKLEHRLHDPVNFIIMPLFALANTAIVFPRSLAPVYASPITWGIVCGLVLGKPLGIFLFSSAATRLKLAALPSGTRTGQLIGIGMIAGVGFTMSIFIATLAFGEISLQVISKIAIIAASLLAGTAGYFYLGRRK